MKILSKQERLAEALKKNLAKRKEQRRERDSKSMLSENEPVESSRIVPQKKSSP